MHHTIKLIAVVVVLLTAWPTFAADPPASEKPVATKNKPRPTTVEEFAALAKEGPLPPWQSFRGHPEVDVQRVTGTVVGVSAEAIEVRPKGEKEAMKYPAHTLLRTGAVCHWQTDSNCYLLDDVQKGDEVMVAYGTVDKEKGPECFYLKIRRRPGGVIPASRKPSEGKEYHVRRQKEVEYEEKGELTPQDIKDYEEKKKLYEKRGLPTPLPPLPPEKPEEVTKKKD